MFVRLKDSFQIVLMQFWSVYLIKCSDNTIYTGCSSDLCSRLSRHRKGQIHYTKTRLPVTLITEIRFSKKYQAYAFERYLKSGSGKAFAKKRLV